MNVDIHLINRLNVGCQSVSRAITLTSDDKYWCGVEIVDSCSVFSGRATQRRTTPLPTQKIAWVVLLTTLSQAVQRLPANSLACNVTRRTPESVAVEGPTDFPNCSALTLGIRISLSHSSRYGKTTVWLLDMNWPVSIFWNSTSNNSRLLGMSISRE